MKRFIRKISLLLSLVIAFTSIGSTEIYADTVSGQKANPPVNLTEITVIGMSVPLGGVPFEKGVTVGSAQGVTWDIPVIWADSDKKAVAVPEAGRRYFPTFVMYAPGGYQIAGRDGSGRFDVKFPDFLTAQGGADKFVYFVDPATGITYITYSAGYVVGPAPAGLAPDGQTSGTGASDGDIEDQADDDAFDPIEAYCDPTAYNTLDREFLTWLIDLIKYTVQPQATNLLLDRFESFNTAARNGELSTEMGLYIYYRTGTFEGDTTPEQALAYVDANYKRGEYRLYMGIDAAEFAVYNAATGKWEFDESNRSDFDNTIVHEMMHAFMEDYTRFGMYYSTASQESGQAFPKWFIEGSATAVENGYQCRYGQFQKLMDGDAAEGDNRYSAASILAGYKTVGNLLMLDADVGDENTGRDYAMGSVAVIYLSYLNALNMGYQREQIVDAQGNFNMDIIRTGFDNILAKLHGDGSGTYPGTSTLDSIIADISPIEGDASVYSNTYDFETKFVKGADGNGDIHSQNFLNEYLNWLENYDMTRDDGQTPPDQANGSILENVQNYDDPLDWDQETISGYYRIPDQGGAAVSSVDDREATLTGGTGIIGQGNHDYAYDPYDEAAAAARTAADPAVQAVADPAVMTPAETVVMTPADPAVQAAADPGVQDAGLAVQTAPVQTTPAPSKTQAVPSGSPEADADTPNIPSEAQSVPSEVTGSFADHPSGLCE